MKLKKKFIFLTSIFFTVVICLAITTAIYVGVSVYIGSQIYNLVESSFESKGKDYEKFTEIIGRINYQCLDYSDGRDENWYKNYHTFPIVIHDFRKAEAHYIYTIEGESIGGYRIPVTISLELKNGKWYVTGVGEPY